MLFTLFDVINRLLALDVEQDVGLGGSDVILGAPLGLGVVEVHPEATALVPAVGRVVSRGEATPVVPEKSHFRVYDSAVIV